jgi:hypothetical protein
LNYAREWGGYARPGPPLHLTCIGIVRAPGQKIPPKKGGRPEIQFAKWRWIDMTGVVWLPGSSLPMA